MTLAVDRSDAQHDLAPSSRPEQAKMTEVGVSISTSTFTGHDLVFTHDQVHRAALQEMHQLIPTFCLTGKLQLTDMADILLPRDACSSMNAVLIMGSNPPRSCCHLLLLGVGHTS